jgi:hypothetical protein
MALWQPSESLGTTPQNSIDYSDERLILPSPLLAMKKPIFLGFR